MYQSAVAPRAARILVLSARSASRGDVENVNQIIGDAGGTELSVCSLFEISKSKLAQSELILIVGWRADAEGIGLLETLRRVESRKPIIVVAAEDCASGRSLAFVKGADNFLIPGFQSEELLAKVSRLISRSHFTLDASPITTRTLRIWPDQRIVMQGNERVLLSRRELAMLICLAKNSPNPVTREVLEKEAFGLRFDPGTNVVAVHVHRLRTKLDNGSDVLRTVSGKGYQLC